MTFSIFTLTRKTVMRGAGGQTGSRTGSCWADEGLRISPRYGTCWPSHELSWAGRELALPWHGIRSGIPLGCRSLTLLAERHLVCSSVKHDAPCHYFSS